MSVGSARDVDVIVIGAGTLGTFHAYFAAQAGHRTLLLERNRFPNDASIRNFGMLLQTIVETDSEWASYASASRAIYRMLQREFALGIRASGGLYIASSEIERQVLQEFAEVFATRFTCHLLSAAETCARYPVVQQAYCHGGLLFPDDLTAEPRQLLRTLIPMLVEREVLAYRPFTTVVIVEQSGRRCIVRDAEGNVYSAAHVFVCSGAEYKLLFPEYFQASGLQVCKLQMMQTVPQPEAILPHATLSGLSIERYPAFKACPSYHLLATQPVEQDLRDFGIHLLFKQALDGTIIIGDSHEYRPLDDAETLAEATNPQINAAILRYGQRMLALPSWELQAMWNGFYLIHPAQNIYTETIAGTIHIVSGIGGKGMSTGPGFSQANVAATLT